MSGLADPAVRAASTLNSEILGSTLQPRSTAQQPRPRSSRSTAGTRGDPEVRIPASIGGGDTRACQIGLGRLVSRILPRRAADERVIVCRETCKTSEPII